MLKYYLTLRIPYPATDEEVRRAYLEMVKRFPPERYPEEFAGISEAYEALKDETMRIHTALGGCINSNYPEEEILLAARLSRLYGGQVGLADLIAVEKQS